LNLILIRRPISRTLSRSHVRSLDLTIRVGCVLVECGFQVQALASWHSGKSGTMNDKGRYLQLRRDRNLQSFFSRNGLQIIPNLGSSEE
jgi:hypothetical protein